jgi:TetR/AcrR family transcriptional repressor of nem operon
MPRPAATSETAARILDVAERLVQMRGFNAFSYADVADALHVTKASLHYHFSTKALLGESLIERYRVSFMTALDRIDQTYNDARAKLHAYVAIYADVLEHDRMCLCGMLAAEYTTLPATMQDGVRRFFDANESWLVATLKTGRKNRQVADDGQPIEVARVLVAALEGALLLARARRDKSHFHAVASRLLADLIVTSPRQPIAPAQPEAHVQAKVAAQPRVPAQTKLAAQRKAPAQAKVAARPKAPTQPKKAAGRR